MQVEIIKPSVEILTPIEEIKEFPKRIEVAGRTCYKSENKITDNSAENFVENIIRSKHESVLEHCSITCRFTVSRACSHQLVRHRLASFSQESQRYVNYHKKDTIRIIVPQESVESLDENLNKLFIESVKSIIETYSFFVSYGMKLEDARYLLPNCIATEVVMTFNIRELRHIFKVRLEHKAQWEIRSVFKQLYDELNKIIPCFLIEIVC
jgi:thymidylate synthase (FAD)